MSKIKIIGIDPSLRNTGIAKGWLDLKTLEWEVEEVELVKTEKGKSKTVRKSSDDYDRTRILYEAIKAAEAGAEIAFVEMPIGSQSADAMKSYGACIALIASLDIPVIQVSPNQVKVHSTGDRNATKEEMIAWAHAKFPDINWLQRGGKLTLNNEHLADAVAAINAGMAEDDFKALITMLRKMTASFTK
jgi:Holliday junction resolvasome RuvABC endonuclease subunit